MQVRERLAIDSGTTFTNKKMYSISRTTVFFFVAFFLCSIAAATFLVYKFALCPNSSGSHVNSIIDKLTLKSDKSHLGNGTILEHLSSSSSKTDVRLPRSIVPIAYDIKLTPFLFEGNFTFFGNVKIQIKIIADCKNITLHAAELKIEKNDILIRKLNKHSNWNHLNNPSQEDVQINKFYTIDTKQFLVIELNETLRKGEELEISISYVGFLLDFLQGFYRSSYTTGNETRWLAATQFQATDARRAFPCFDEPALKAKFNLSIARPKHMQSISNMPKINSTSKPVEGISDYVWDIYQESVPMSTYLVAFVVTDFEKKTNGNFTVWARSDAINSAKYALEVGPKILQFLEKFFGIKFPLPKIDMIALPDFHAGAMENWGLITYRETAMLYEDGVSASGIKQRVATIVAHELAHQWFGNLVTPSWWSDIWLNEGFASYMEYLGVQAVEPDWQSMDQFVVNELQNVFILDALSSSHKISVEVGNPDEINEIFDRISYGKGATIIRMMNHFLTFDVFREGLRGYLSEMAYKSAEQDDLWRFLTIAARNHKVFDNLTSVKEIMDTWTLQIGFPVVFASYNITQGVIELHQERFTYVRKNSSTMKTQADPVWWIPLTFTSSENINFNDTRPISWMRKTKTSQINDISISSTDWFMLNLQQTGYYRVSYDVSNWKLIIKYLQDINKFKKIAPANRAQLIDDAMNLARGGYLNYNVALDVTLYLRHEDNFVPWKSAITALNFIDSMLIRTGNYNLLKKYVLMLLEKPYAEVGFDDSKDRHDILKIYKRIDILSAACHLGYMPCVSECQIQFFRWTQNPRPDISNPISPNLRSLVYCTTIKYGSEIEWDFLYDRFLNTNVPSEKEILLSAMGCSREIWILSRYLKRSLSDQYGIRKQDVFRVFIAVSNNAVGQTIAFNFIRANFREMKEYLGSVMANLNSLVKYSTRRMNTLFELEELQKFVSTHYKDSGRSIQQAIERVEVNIAWMDKNYKSIIEWLSKTNHTLYL